MKYSSSGVAKNGFESHGPTTISESSKKFGQKRLNYGNMSLQNDEKLVKLP